MLLLAATISLAGDLDYILKDYGIKGGLSLANQVLSIEPESQLYYIIKGAEFKLRPGFTAGIYAEWFNEPYINLVTEFNYVQKGTIYNTGAATPTEYNNRMDYLSIPVMAKLKYPDFRFLPYLLFGIRYDYLLSRHIESEIILYDESKSGNLGISMGAGFEFDALNFPLLLEYSFHSQYATLLEEDQHQYTVRNISHSVVLGYKFKSLLHPRPEVEFSQQKEKFSLHDPLLQQDSSAIPARETRRIKEGKAAEENSSGLTRRTLAVRSLLLPGSAQFSTRRYISGSTYSLLFTAAVYFCYHRINTYNQMVDGWKTESEKITPETLFYDAERIQARCNQLKKEIDNYEKTVYYSLAGLTAVYLANVMDAVIFAPEDQLKVTIDPQIRKKDSKITLAVEFKL